MLHGSRSYLLQDDDGQVLEAHSISAGLDYPGIGPQLSALFEAGRLEILSATDDEAVDGVRLLTRSEGILPALEPAHAVAALGGCWPAPGSRAVWPTTRSCCSACPGAATRTSARWRPERDRRDTGSSHAPDRRYGRDRRRGADQGAVPAAAAAGRAALIPYAVAGYPDAETSLAAALASIDAGADLLEIGLPYSDPLADGPRSSAPARVALRSGATFDRSLELLARIHRARPKVPLVAMGYVNQAGGRDGPRLPFAAWPRPGRAASSWPT